MEYLSKTYLGNSLEQWLLSLTIIALTVVGAKVLFWFSGRIVRRLTVRTKNRLDDLLVDCVETPAVVMVTLLGVWYGLGRLTLPALLAGWGDIIIQFFLFLAIAWLAARLFDAFFRVYVVPLADRSKTDFDDQILPVVQKAAKSAIWIIGIVVALENAGQNVGALLAGLGIGGLALAMAAKDTVSNIFGGFTIFVDRPFKLNDRVRAAGFDGFVREVGLRSTRIQTLDGTIATIPNSRFADTAVENVSLEPSRKITLGLGLTYDTTPEQMERAMAILQEICDQDEGVEKAVVFFSDFGDFSMNVKLIYYILKIADIPSTQSRINLEVLRRFNQAGLEFAFPTQTLYTKPLG